MLAVLPATLLLLSPPVMGEVLGAPMGEEGGELVGVGEGVTTNGGDGDDVGAGVVAACRYNYNIWTYSPIGVVVRIHTLLAVYGRGAAFGEDVSSALAILVCSITLHCKTREDLPILRLMMGAAIVESARV